MKATSFDQCFGWLHPASGNNVIIFCNAYGHEALLSHRGIRKLSEQLCARRTTALRFDYLGTGDSAGDEDDGEQIEQWIGSIEHAIRHVRRQFGARKIVLCGLRLGAMLAGLAAERLQDTAPIDGLILMSPVISGKDYLRELKLIQRRWRNTPGNMPDTPEVVVPGAVETFGFRLNASTVEHLAQLDMSSASRKRAAIPILIFDSDAHPSAKLAAAMDGYRTAGGEVTRIDFLDEPAYLGDRISAVIPAESFDAISDWLVMYFPASAITDAPIRAKEAHEALGVTDADAAGSEIEIRGDHYREIPVHFGNGRLFGIYCQPLGTDGAASGAHGIAAEILESDDPQTAVLFPNTGGNHHIGDARMWVIQARHLARLGVASLRMDITGLGDSTDDVDRSTAAGLHAASAWEDSSAGIDWLAERCHAEPMIVGVCSGAFIAFNAAVSNPRVSGIVLINQWVFTYEAKRHGLHGQLPKPTRVYRDAMRNVGRWRRVLREKGKLTMIASVIVLRTIERLRQYFAPLHDAFLPHANADSTSLSVRAMMQLLARRGVRIHVIFGALDAGIEEFEIYFGKGFSRLKRFPTVRVSIESTIDHALFLYPGRERLTNLIDEFILEQQSGKGL